MRVFITGTEGYIGARLGPHLLDCGHEVVGLDSGFYGDGCLYLDPLGHPVRPMGPAGADNRSYRVSFDKIHSRLPGFFCHWDARRGAEELRSLFERIEMSGDTYEFRAFTRLKQLKYLQRTGQLDDDLETAVNEENMNKSSRQVSVKQWLKQYPMLVRIKREAAVGSEASSGPCRTIAVVGVFTVQFMTSSSCSRWCRGRRISTTSQSRILFVLFQAA